jgi:hypothetical protein
MSSRRSLDNGPGSLPEIRPDGTSVKFLIDVTTVRNTPRLVLRCDAQGEVWAAIDTPDHREVVEPAPLIQ